MNRSIVETKYINLLSGTLRNFRKKGINLYNFSCPICGDSDKIKSKARGYLFERSNKYFYKCHNCNISTTFDKLLKQVRTDLYQDYVFDLFSGKRGQKFSTPIEIPKKAPTQSPETNLAGSFLVRCDTLDDNHPVKKYLQNRTLSKYYTNFWYTEDFGKTVKAIFGDLYSYESNKEPRIVIPIYSQDNTLLGIQGRSLDPEEKARKYITLKFNKQAKMCYGMHNVNFSDTVYIVEGPIDSMFLQNSLAVLSSSLYSIELPVTDNFVFVYDNEPRNKEILEAMSKTIKLGYNICIWPETIKQKDINDMVSAGKTEQEIIDIINSNTYSKLLATVQFNKWKKC